MKLSLEEVRNIFEPGIYGRGNAYRRDGRVMEALVRPDGSIHGVVEGNDRQYSQSISLRTHRSGIDVTGRCTCHLGENCQHVAAILIELAVNGAEISASAQSYEATLTREQREWLSEFDANFLGQMSNAKVAANQPLLVYLVDLPERNEPIKTVRVRAVTARPGENGRLIQGPFRMPHFFSGTWPKYVPDGDRILLSLLSRNFLPGSTTEGSFQLSGPLGDIFFRQIVESGRARWGEIDAPVLSLGPAKRGTPRWVIGGDGSQRFAILIDKEPNRTCQSSKHVDARHQNGIAREEFRELEYSNNESNKTKTSGFQTSERSSLCLPLWNPWYVDLDSYECGPIEFEHDSKLIRALVAAPTVTPEQSNAFAEELRKRAPFHDSLVPDAKFESEEIEVNAVPVLRVSRIEAIPYKSSGAPANVQLLTVASLSFRYGDNSVNWSDSRQALTTVEGKKLITTRRSIAFEQEAVRRLTDAGWGPISSIRREFRIPAKHADDLVMYLGVPRSSTLACHDNVLAFVYHQVPLLKAEGWEVVIDSDVDVPISAIDKQWDIRLDDIDSDWFNLNMGIEVGGEHIDLMPVLLKLTTSLYRSHLNTVPDDQVIFGQLEDGRKIALLAGRIKPLVKTLFELYDFEQAQSVKKKFPKWRAAELLRLEHESESLNLHWQGSSKLKENASRLVEAQKAVVIPPPSSFVGNLRGYQKEGVGWLQLLRDIGFSGVLADDMGLGKTVQTLAHLLIEFEAGRLDAPALIVAPTSLMTNWRREAEKFAPSLKVLTIHGPDRKSLFEKIPESQIVLTTYALLARDMPELERYHYHIVLLDEAQNIKNPKTNAARAAKSLRANQRICLTGTPMENHLGELWSIFDFLLPGFLGSEQHFQKQFRLPIEKSNSDERRKALTRRVRPFMLRRTKEEVVKELPPKTEIIEHIELHGAQRDLYESIRLAMHARVRDAVQRQGVSKSHIVILDALLKLRQVCCDPRLLKLESAHDVQESAKLERLLEMLPEMIDEGRKVLLFSQFTSMLALIEQEMRKRSVSYAKLTGETVDRGEQVEKFQSGAVPLFLLSLKAGGTGLNLTAADTVIHYDPWWNPAAERQASDRAHRIGQDKPVFVYKLCTLNTVEEKIQELQSKKQELADALFDDGESSTLRLSEQDLDWIFQRPD